METTNGTLLGGKIRYAQPKYGHRSGIEPVILAAAVPIHPGQSVLEGGTGAGAALLCLAYRVFNVVGVGVELDADLAALANANFHLNGYDNLRADAADISLVSGLFNHVMANPPWHPESGTRSPVARRNLARRASRQTAATWTMALARVLSPQGTLNLIVPASTLPAFMSALAEVGCGSIRLLPLWPKPGRPAKLVILRAIRGGRSPMRVEAGLLLHGPDGQFTDEASAILQGHRGVAWPA